MTTHFTGAKRATITWMPVSGVQPLVYVAKVEGKPVAILQMKPDTGFDLTDCATGELIGRYNSMIEGQDALSEWLDEAVR